MDHLLEALNGLFRARVRDQLAACRVEGQTSESVHSENYCHKVIVVSDLEWGMFVFCPVS